MANDGPRFGPGTPVRVAHQSAARAKLAMPDSPLHEHYGDIGRVTDVEETPRAVRYEIWFHPYGDERLVFNEEELEPAPPRKT